MYDNTKGRTATASLELAATAKQKFDEFLRRQLGVSDANDPKTVVQALRKLYPSEATRLDEEGQGLPIRFLTSAEPATAAPVMGAESPGQRRLQQVQEALEADLESVMNHPSNRAYKAPLGGWRDAVLAELREGVEASYRAVDPVARDRTFYTVRKLGDYACVARLVGARNPMVRVEFRRLASTLDMVAIILRVLAGEALFRAGFDEGGNVFQVPAQDLRQRKEGLIAALERFNAASAESDPWNDGEASYGLLLERLAEHGYPELRSIVRPDAMARLLSVLLNNIQQQQADSLRGLASAAPIELMQLRRLHDAAASLLSSQQGAPPTGGEATSAPMVALVRALELFISAFDKPSAGSRLLRLVLPSPLESLQLAGTNGQGSTIRTLFEERAQIQVALDMLNADPDFDPADWPASIKLDRALRDIDRAIDLYLLDAGELEQSQVGQRSWLHGWMLRRWIRTKGFDGKDTDWTISVAGKAQDELRKRLDNVVEKLAPGTVEPDPAVAQLFLTEQYALDKSAFQLAESLTQGPKDWEQTVSKVLEGYTAYPGVTGAIPKYRVPSTTRGSLDELARTHRGFTEEFSRQRRAAQQQQGQAGAPPAGPPGAGGPLPVDKELDQLLRRVRSV